MEPEVRERFERIEATSAHTAEHHERALAAFDKRMDKLEKRHEEAMQRMDKFDRQLQATRKLVEAGMKIVMRLAVDAREARKETKELKAEFRAYLRSQKNGHSGSNGRSH